MTGYDKGRANLPAMFGFLRVRKGAVSPEQREVYQAHFCATCHAMDAFGGKLSTFLTNYDVTFWVLLATALDPRPGVIERKTCTAFPWRKVPVMRLSDRCRRAVAAMNLALVAAKVEDDRLDGERRAVRWAFQVLRGPVRKAEETLRELGFPLAVIADLGRAQKAAEAAEHPSLDTLAEPTAAMMAALFGSLAGLTERSELESALQTVGRALGRLLYFLDALSDLDKDRRRCQFNAILRVYGERFSHTLVRTRLKTALGDFERAAEALPIEREELLEGLFEHLRGELGQAMRRLHEVPPSLPRRMLARAGFWRPPHVQDDCDCGGCDGCDCSGCDGCQGCECQSCDCSHCGQGCECGSCEAPAAECCCDSSDSCDWCDCCDTDKRETICCCCGGESARRKKNEYQRLDRKKKRKGRKGEPEPPQEEEDTGQEPETEPKEEEKPDGSV